MSKQKQRDLLLIDAFDFKIQIDQDDVYDLSYDEMKVLFNKATWKRERELIFLTFPLRIRKVAYLLLFVFFLQI